MANRASQANLTSRNSPGRAQAKPKAGKLSDVQVPCDTNAWTAQVLGLCHAVKTYSLRIIDPALERVQ